jgi:uncharacterized membrane protein
MTAPTPPVPEPGRTPPKLNEAGALRALVHAVRDRIVSGLVAALPIALTFFIVHWLYVTVSTFVLVPVIEAVKYVMGDRLGNTFWYTYFSPVIAVVLILGLLYALGLVVRLRFMRAVDWVMLQVPVVNTIFKALTNVFQSLGQQLQGDRGFKRVVLVEYPHPGMRALGFVTNTLHDATTDRTILCVCVLTGVMPPAGFTLFVPEEHVTDIDWTMNQTLQAIISGGITAPASIHYTRGLRVPSTGPILDPSGHPVAAAPAAIDAPEPGSGSRAAAD